MAPDAEVLPVPVSPGVTALGRDGLPESAQERAELRNKVNRARVEREKEERGKLDVPTRKAPDERNEALERAVRIQVAQGARVESQGDYRAILVKGQRTNHIPMVALIQEGCISVAVDEWGNTNVQKLPWTRASRSGV